MNLTEQYREYISSSIAEEGISIPPAMLLEEDDKLTIMALALTPEQAYRAVLEQIDTTSPKEAIFSLDRYTKEGQGTTLGDVMAGHYYKDGEFTPFIIEYQHEPRIVKEIDWDNEWWNEVLARELSDVIKMSLNFSISH